MREEKLKKFVNDEVMFEVVFDEIEKIIKKKKSNADVNVLASVTLSLYGLEDTKGILKSMRNSVAGGEKQQILHV